MGAGRLTPEAHTKLHEEIRNRLRVFLRPYEIQKQLGMSKSALYRHLQELRQEDQSYLDSMAREAFASAWIQSLHNLEDQIRELIIIRQNAKKSYEKIQATLAIRDIALDRINLLSFGPTVYQVSRSGQQEKEATSSAE